MIRHQFAVTGTINITLWLQAFGYSQRYINDHLDKYHYFLHCITEKKVFNRAIGHAGFVGLNMRYLENFLGCRYAHEVKNNLLAWKMIECDGSYQVGKTNLGYRIHSAYQGKAILHEVMKTETMVPKLAKLHAEYVKKTTANNHLKNLKLVSIRFAEALTFIDAKLDTSLTLIESHEGILSSFDSKSGIDNDWYSSFYEDASLLCGMYPLMSIQFVKKAFHKANNEGITAYDLLMGYVTDQYNADLVAITKIHHQNYFYRQPDLASRIFTNVSNLSTDLRQFLIHRRDKAQLVNLDIRNSQPYLLSLLLTDFYGKETLPKDVKHYIELTSQGRFYEYMMDALGIDAGKRRAFKIKFFASLFFCQNHHAARTPAGKKFKQEFPNVYELIRREKADDYKALALKMQRREASVILGVIGKELLKRGIWFVSIHDSVVVTENNVEAVKSIVCEAFLTAVGVAPSIEEDVLVNAKNVATGNPVKEEEEAELLGAIYMLEGWEDDVEEKAKEIAQMNEMVKTLVEENAQAVNIIITTEAGHEDDSKNIIVAGNPVETEYVEEPNLSTWEEFTAWAVSVWGEDWLPHYQANQRKELAW